LFCYEISMMVGFVHLRDLTDSWFSVSVGFVLLWDFNDGRIYLVYEISMTFVLFGHEISVMAGFVRLRDVSDGQFFSFTRFQWQSVFIDSHFYSVTRSHFGLFCPFAKFKWWSVLSHHVILVIVLFFPLWDFKDSEWWSVYKTSMMVGFFLWFSTVFQRWSAFVSYWYFSDSWFCSITRFR